MPEYLAGVGSYYLWHPTFQLANNTILKNYNPQHKVALFVPCSWAKPYSQSYIHAELRKDLRSAGLLNCVDYIHVSSGGIVPHAYETQYPWTAYDWNNSWIDPGDEVTFQLLRQAIRLRFVDFIRTITTRSGGWKRMLCAFRESSNTMLALQAATADLRPYAHPRYNFELVALPAHQADASADELYKELYGYVDPDVSLFENSDMIIDALMETLEQLRKQETEANA